MRRSALLAAAASSLSLVASAHATTAGTVPGDAAFPESIASAPSGNTVYVSSFATGAVVKGTIGRALRPFLTAGADGRTSATGLNVDARNRLLILTGRALQLQIVNAKTGKFEGRLTANDGHASNLNDLVITKSGDAYITETGTPAIYRATARQLARRKGRLTRWVAPRSSIVPNDPSHLNFNGIALTADEHYLLVGQTATGNLYRVDLKTRAIRRVAITGGSLAGSDGLLLSKRVLYVVTHSGGIKKVTLNDRYTAGRVTATLTDPTLAFPTSITGHGRRLIVTNALKPAGAPNFTLTSFPA
jgi:Cu-Zn family superoxide dismutase